MLLFLVVILANALHLLAAWALTMRSMVSGAFFLEMRFIFKVVFRHLRF